MDFWDPALIDALARSRPILLLDYSGVGKSEGEIQTSFQGWAANVLAVINALQIRKVDLLGFSMYVFLSLEQLPTDTNYIGEEQLPNMLSSRHQASCVGLSSPEPAQAVHQTHYSAQNTFSWPWQPRAQKKNSKPPSRFPSSTQISRARMPQTRISSAYTPEGRIGPRISVPTLQNTRRHHSKSSVLLIRGIRTSVYESSRCLCLWPMGIMIC